jgi:ferric-dicitrate binding protein FerR (iron transport regulator)
MMIPEQQPEEAGVDSYFRGEASAEDVFALEQRLLNDGKARAEFRKAARMDANLRFNAAVETAEFREWRRASDESITVTQPEAKIGSRFRTNWPLGAVALATAAVVALAIWMNQPSKSPESNSPGYVATLLSAGNLQGTSRINLQSGTRLPTGDFRLAGGTAKVRFDSGIVLALVGMADFQIVSRQCLMLRQGKLMFQSDATSEPFTLRTPRSVFQDIGTEFAMMVRAADEELHVVSGKVRRTSPTDPSLPSEVSTAKTSKRYTSASLAGSPIPFNASLSEQPRSQVEDAAVAPLLVFEPFHYQGTIATGADHKGGTGWRGSWLEARAMPSVGFNDQESLPWRGLKVEGGAVHTTGRTAMHRMLQRPLRLDRDAVYYFSYLFRRSESAGNGLNMLMFVLRQSGKTEEQEIADGSTLKISFVREDAVASIHLFERTVRAAVPLEPNTTYLLIGKIVAGSTMPDQAFIKVYSSQDAVPATEPADWLLATDPIDTDLVLDQVSLEFDTTAEIGFDELKIGTTWAGVIR